MALPPVGDQGHLAVTRRVALRAMVTAGLLISVAAFAAVFLRGLLGPEEHSANVIDLGGIRPGTARLEAWNGEPVWALSRSEDQLNALAGLSDYVRTPPPGGPSPVGNLQRSVKRRYGIYLARTARAGILVQYTRDRPKSLPPDVPWFGGFVDPATGAAFDVAGRPYRATPGRALRVPPHRYLGPTVVRLGEW